MLRTIKKLLGSKYKQLTLPISLMAVDAALSIVLYFILYLTTIHLLDNTLTAGRVIAYTVVCLVSVILRLIIYRSGNYLCYARGSGNVRGNASGFGKSLPLFELGLF